MPQAGFEPAIPAILRLQTYALDRTATRNGLSSITIRNISLVHHTSFAKTNKQSTRTEVTMNTCLKHPAMKICDLNVSTIGE